MACGAFWRDRAQINEEHAALAKLVHGEHEQRRQRPPSVSAQQLSTDIIEKDSADALGDIFFYITDRLTVPYD